MGQNYEYRFELKPGKFVYIPTCDALKDGKSIVDALRRSWSPAEYFCHFGKRGGHVTAMRAHLPNKFIASIDIEGFFTSITRTKIHRALGSVGYSNRYALDVASRSCVEVEGRKFLPYGFVQSMALATLAVEKSELGKRISLLRDSKLTITMFVDDIIISSNSQFQLKSGFDCLNDAISVSNFSMSVAKSSPPNSQLNVFNCMIESGSMRIDDSRMERFIEQLKTCSDLGRISILKYIKLINHEQHNSLCKTLSI